VGLDLCLCRAVRAPPSGGRRVPRCGALPGLQSVPDLGASAPWGQGNHWTARRLSCPVAGLALLSCQGARLCSVCHPVAVTWMGARTPAKLRPGMCCRSAP
jgi:hypothetical protein